MTITTAKAVIAKARITGTFSITEMEKARFQEARRVQHEWRMINDPSYRGGILRSEAMGRAYARSVSA